MGELTNEKAAPSVDEVRGLVERLTAEREQRLTAERKAAAMDEALRDIAAMDKHSGASLRERAASRTARETLAALTQAQAEPGAEDA